MDPLAALPQPVINALARGWTILTGNQRAARTLRRLFDLRQHAFGLTSWQPPSILAWDSWLATQWHRLLLEGHASALLLNSAQEHALWRSIIAADPGASSLRPLDSLAELASDAWRRLHTYGGQRRLHAAASTTDTRAFARWAAEFERRCLRAQYITTVQLPEALIAASQTAPPAGLLLSGFDLTTPAQTALLEALRSAGTPIHELDPADSLSQSIQPPLLLDAPDLHAELLACARWLRGRLTENPSAQLAVIVPDIAAERAAIDRSFRNILAPELDNIAAPSASAPYEFSLGVPLDGTPIAALALDILHWCNGPLPLDHISALLLSPHFAHGRQATASHTELLARAEFDAFTLRDRPLLEPRLTVDELTSLASRAKQSSQLPLLLAGLRALIAAVHRSALSRDRTHSEWASAFQQVLDAAGWAPVVDLDSAEFQARSKWESALDELSTLDFGPQSRVSFRAALDALARIAAQTLFAPESRHAPIQIMGPLESAGSSFAALWFLRAGDLTWPPVPATNPLLPYSLQRDLAMPGADPHADTAHASRITHRIAASAPHVVVSYAQQTSDGHQRPSPLLSDLNLTARAATEILPADPAPVPIPLDRLLDTTPIPAPPNTALRGGASILEAQAACAFRAFAERRLFSSSPEDVSLGLDARDRGSIVHSVLHDFWLQVRTQSALRAMTTPDRDALLAQCIQSALARDHSHPAAGWPTAYIDAERARLLRLLRPWLDFEANTRPPFVVKSSEEQIKGVPIGPLHLDIRVDRTDETVPEPGQQPAEIILDYKTGSADPSRWEGDRPDSPQLPLYAVVSPAPHLAAVAFATIRPGKFMGLSGLQSQDGILPRAKRGQTLDLEAKRKEWGRILTSLAEEFHSGRAIPSPKEYPHTCRYCRQRLLCRLDPSSLTQHDEIDPGDANTDSPAAFPSGPEAQP